MSIITVGELDEAAFVSPNPHAHLTNMRRFLNAWQVLSLSDPAMEQLAEIRAFLRRRGELIADFDSLIAATAIHYNLTLLTFNVRHVQRIPDLKLYQVARYRIRAAPECDVCGTAFLLENPMQLSVIAYVKDMRRAVAFYESLGFQRRGEMNPMWNEFVFGDAIFALHGAMSDELAPPTDRLSLSLLVDGAALDRLYATCEERGYPLGGPIQDIGFGRFFWTTDPDGLPLQFNERRDTRRER